MCRFTGTKSSSASPFDVDFLNVTPASNWAWREGQNGRVGDDRTAAWVNNRIAVWESDLQSTPVLSVLRDHLRMDQDHLLSGNLPLLSQLHTQTHTHTHTHTERDRQTWLRCHNVHVRPTTTGHSKLYLLLLETNKNNSLLPKRHIAVQ